MSFLEAFDWMMKEFGEKVAIGNRSQGSLDKMKYTRDKLVAFMKDQLKVSDILMEHIKPGFVYDFEHYSNNKTFITEQF